ncbi:hypothetical protein FX016_18430 [Cupriavidus gilardii]|nr:hypothetical protein FX016_18430 [Cupriavidus gilardii]
MRGTRPGIGAGRCRSSGRNGRGRLQGHDGRDRESGVGVGSGSRESGVGSRESGAGSREPGVGSRESLGVPARGTAALWSGSPPRAFGPQESFRFRRQRHGVRAGPDGTPPARPKNKKPRLDTRRGLLPG